jgi:hypothetical protein
MGCTGGSSGRIRDFLFFDRQAGRPWPPACTGLHEGPIERLMMIRRANISDGCTADSIATGPESGRAKEDILCAVSRHDKPWKADDAAWFKNCRNRSHRLRPPYAGEAEGLCRPGYTLQSRPGFEVMILVRQVEPGRRIRVPVLLRQEDMAEDGEAILHAVFDLTVAGTPLTASNILAMVQARQPSGPLQ